MKASMVGIAVMAAAIALTGSLDAKTKHGKIGIRMTPISGPPCVHIEAVSSDPPYTKKWCGNLIPPNEVQLDMYWLQNGTMYRKSFLLDCGISSDKGAMPGSIRTAYCPP